MKHTLSTLVLVALAGCATVEHDPKKLVTDTPAIKAADQAYRQCAYRHGMQLGVGSDSAREVGTTAVGMCRAQALALQEAIEKANEAHAWGRVAAESYVNAVRRQLVDDVAYATTVARSKTGIGGGTVPASARP